MYAGILTVGSRIGKLRKQSGYTQRELAERLQVTKAVISAYETGNRIPSCTMIVKLAALFNVSTDYLLWVSTGSFLDLSGLTMNERKCVINLVRVMR